MIKWVLNFLRNNRILNIVLAVIYFFAVVLPHEQVGLIISKIFKNSTKAYYNQTILIIASIGLIIYVLFLILNLKNNDSKKIVFAFLSLSVFLSVLMLKTILILNIELIHLVQYGAFALILFPLFEHYFHTLWCCTFLGGIDEAFQYYYLAPNRTNFLDFNDMILNLVGATFGLILIRSVPLFNKSTGSNYPRNFSIFTAVLSLLILGILAIKDLLIKVPAESFWTTLPSKVTYHIVHPIEGIIIIAVLLIIYAFLNKPNKVFN